MGYCATTIEQCEAHIFSYLYLFSIFHIFFIILPIFRSSYSLSFFDSGATVTINSFRFPQFCESLLVLNLKCLFSENHLASSERKFLFGETTQRHLEAIASLQRSVTAGLICDNMLHVLDLNVKGNKRQNMLLS